MSRPLPDAHPRPLTTLMSLSLLLLAVSASWPIAARAEVAPSLRVVGVEPTESVNLRERPSMRGRVLTRLPHDAKGLRSIGVATDRTGRPAAKHAYWCGVQYEALSGWVACRYLSPDDDAR